MGVPYMLFEFLFLKEHLRAVDERRAMPSERHVLLLHVSDPIIEGVDILVRRFAVIENAEVRLKVSDDVLPWIYVSK